ncbi:MAG: cobalt-precorrin-6A reductase [Ilumatobacteraceae bacterium]
MPRVLILAGTTEATVLAGRLDAMGHEVVSSLAGVTSRPVDRPGRVRSGGFGGAHGLARFLDAEQIGAVVDATHPFAAVMPFNVSTAARRVGLPHCRLLRPPWTPADGDRWVEVPTLEAAARALRQMDAERAFLAVGRQSIGAFAACHDVAFVVRAIEPIGDALPGAETVLQRGPFDVDRELELLTGRRIDVVVTKNSGGTATAAKLAAARRLDIPVVMVDRPSQPDVATVETVAAAVDWLEGARRAGWTTCGHVTRRGV